MEGCGKASDPVVPTLKKKGTLSAKMAAHIERSKIVAIYEKQRSLES